MARKNCLLLCTVGNFSTFQTCHRPLRSVVSVVPLTFHNLTNPKWQLHKLSVSWQQSQRERSGEIALSTRLMINHIVAMLKSFGEGRTHTESEAETVKGADEARNTQRMSHFCHWSSLTERTRPELLWMFNLLMLQQIWRNSIAKRAYVSKFPVVNCREKVARLSTLAAAHPKPAAASHNKPCYGRDVITNQKQTIAIAGTSKLYKCGKRHSKTFHTNTHDDHTYGDL